MKTLTSVEAQNRFGELLDSAQREPVSITRRGRTAAFMISPREFASLSEGRSTRGTVALRAAAQRAIAGFRGSGQGGSTTRLTAERKAERRREG
jgi:prevent-host-death family protein